MKSLVDDVVVTCDKIVNIPENASISPNNGINYWFIAAVLCVCVCVCVCVYNLSTAGFFRLQDVCYILEMFGSTFVVSVTGTSAKFLHLRI